MCEPDFLTASDILGGGFDLPKEQEAYVRPDVDRVKESLVACFPYRKQEL
jgi:hypothetical protein